MAGSLTSAVGITRQLQNLRVTTAAPGHVGLAPRAKVQPRAATFRVDARQAEPGIGIYGTKAGMTQIYKENGVCLPATVIAIDEGNIVTQVKTPETDGYGAVQIAYEPVKLKNIRKPELGHLKKAGAPPLRHLREFKVCWCTRLPAQGRCKYQRNVQQTAIGELENFPGQSGPMESPSLLVLLFCLGGGKELLFSLVTFIRRGAEHL